MPTEVPEMAIGNSSFATAARMGPTEPLARKKKKNRIYSTGSVMLFTNQLMSPDTIIKTILQQIITGFLPNRLASQPNKGLPKINAKANVDNTPPVAVLLRP